MELIGFRKHVMETREPLMLEELTPEVLERYGNPSVLSGEPAKSEVFVPLVVGASAIGVISLQNVDRRHAFSDSDQQLLETLAGSLSVALENARLVDETRQRNAELALINSVQEALAGELELQAIYDAVGDRIRDVFDAQVVDIGIYDEPSGLVHFLYTIERGVRFPDEPIELIGFRKHVIETRETLMIEESTAEVAERYGNPRVLSGEPGKSTLFVPLVVGGRATGVISLQNVDRAHAFSDSDQQLLETLAGSLSVALENARLVDETRQRNAELALINSVQEAIAGELDPQAIYDAVGDRIREVFDAQVARHRHLRRGVRPGALPVHDRARRALPGQADRADRLPQARDRNPRDTDDRGEEMPEVVGALRKPPRAHRGAGQVVAIRPPGPRRACHRRGLASERRPDARL